MGLIVILYGGTGVNITFALATFSLCGICVWHCTIYGTFRRCNPVDLTGVGATNTEKLIDKHSEWLKLDFEILFNYLPKLMAV